MCTYPAAARAARIGVSPHLCMDVQARAGVGLCTWVGYSTCTCLQVRDLGGNCTCTGRRLGAHRLAQPGYMLGEGDTMLKQEVLKSGVMRGACLSGPCTRTCTGSASAPVHTYAAAARAARTGVPPHLCIELQARAGVGLCTWVEHSTCTCSQVRDLGGNCTCTGRHLSVHRPAQSCYMLGEGDIMLKQEVSKRGVMRGACLSGPCTCTCTRSASATRWGMASRK